MVAIETRDYHKIQKLIQLTDPETFWDDVRKLLKKTVSDHSIHRWQCLAEQRYDYLKRIEYIHNKLKETNAAFEMTGDSFRVFTAAGDYDVIRITERNDYSINGRIVDDEDFDTWINRS